MFSIYGDVFLNGQPAPNGLQVRINWPIQGDNIYTNTQRDGVFIYNGSYPRPGGGDDGLFYLTDTEGTEHLCLDECQNPVTIYLWDGEIGYHKTLIVGVSPFVPLCDWLAANWPLEITSVIALVDSYILQTPPEWGNFIPVIVEVFGTIDYYLGFDGDSDTGCDLY